jgi:hypothetical protein
MNIPDLLSRILVILGSIATLVGALDPMEGSIVILVGSGLVALGTFLGHREHRWIVYRTWMFILVAIGVGAMWALTLKGGIGGNSGRSIWWALLILPYPVGWTMGIWGPGSPRWLLATGIIIGGLYLVILAFVLSQGAPRGLGPVIMLGILGLATIIGCFNRLRIIDAART